MRVWIDLTNSPHVVVMRPVIELLRSDGHEVRVTARDFAQTLGLLRHLEISHTAIGRHRGERLTSKATGLAQRSGALIRWAVANGPRGGFDIALGHGSNDVSVAAAVLGIPSSTMFDYEYASVQHHINCRLADTVVVPDAIAPERLFRYGARGKVRSYEGLKEEYYLADFTADEKILGELGLDPERVIVVVRTAPEVSLYHRFENDILTKVLERCAREAVEHGAQTVVLPRTDAQRRRLADHSSLIVPERAIDAQSLIAHADLVISAGGTMNREAVALATPVYTTFAGRIGAVDERLIAAGRMRILRDPLQLDLSKRANDARGSRVGRDPRRLVELLLSPVAR